MLPAMARGGRRSAIGGGAFFSDRAAPQEGVNPQAPAPEVGAQIALTDVAARKAA